MSQLLSLNLPGDPSSVEDITTRLVIRQHTKSRTGCLTCKTRRIKCDEAKPECERCKKGFFTCDGYTPPESRKTTVVSQRPHTKSKNGCGNCKARRVKCDETKPKCGWCSKSGRQCKYEEVVPSSASVVEKKPKSPQEIQPRYPSVPHLSLNLNLGNGNTNEKLNFHFYVDRMGPMLAGACDHEFWNRIIIQRTVIEPALWHSIMAVCMLQQISISRSSKLATMDLRADALQHYNKAVGLLTQKNTDAQVSIEILTMSCLVFVCIEALLGDIERSRIHIASGQRIINDWKIQNPSVPVYQRVLMEGHIEPIFQNMSSQSSFYITRGIFEKLKQATCNFENAYRDLDVERWTLTLGIAQEQKANLLARSHNWIKNFETFLCQPVFIDLNVEEIDAIPYMRYQHTLLHIRILVLLNVDELAYDQHRSIFEKAMNHADEAWEGILFRGPKFTTGLLPSLNEEVSPLFTIATKCRNPRIRRRAIELMKKTRDQLLFRDDDLSTKVAERAISMEEEGLESLIDDTGTIVPSDWARIYEILVDSRAGHEITGQHRGTVSFKRKSKTQVGQWIWTSGFVDYTVTACASSIASKR